MIEGCDILRLDAAASGGIGYALEGLALARGQGRSVIPHVFATLHQHLGFANDTVERIEAILPELGADPIDAFLMHPMQIEDGMLVAPINPGAGVTLDWHSLERFTTHQEVLTR